MENIKTKGQKNTNFVLFCPENLKPAEIIGMETDFVCKCHSIKMPFYHPPLSSMPLGVFGELEWKHDYWESEKCWNAC